MSIEEKVREILFHQMKRNISEIVCDDTLNRLAGVLTNALLTSPDIEVVDKATQTRAEKYRAALEEIYECGSLSQAEKIARQALEEKP